MKVGRSEALLADVSFIHVKHGVQTQLLSDAFTLSFDSEQCF
jgi:hypothetical protein